MHPRSSLGYGSAHDLEYFWSRYRLTLGVAKINPFSASAMPLREMNQFSPLPWDYATSIFVIAITALIVAAGVLIHSPKCLYAGVR